MLPDLGARLREDLETCQELVLVRQQREVIGELAAAIAEADAQRETLSRVLNGSEPVSTAIVVRLRNALLGAVRNASGEQPWLMWRAFTLRLHNQFQLTAAALAYARCGYGGPVTGSQGKNSGRPVRTPEADVRVLERELASRKLKEAMEAKRTADAIQLSDELIALEPDAAQREKWLEIRQQLERQLPKRREVGSWRIVAVLLTLALFGWAIIPMPDSVTPYSSPSSSAPTMPAPPPAISPDNRTIKTSESRSQAYLEGQADWHAWAKWFNALSGDYRNGAEY